MCLINVFSFLKPWCSKVFLCVCWRQCYLKLISVSRTVSAQTEELVLHTGFTYASPSSTASQHGYRDSSLNEKFNSFMVHVEMFAAELFMWFKNKASAEVRTFIIFSSAWKLCLCKEIKNEKSWTGYYTSLSARSDTTIALTRQSHKHIELLFSAHWAKTLLGNIKCPDL